MIEITFIGAGSAVFANNVLGDAMLTPALSDAYISLCDIDSQRLPNSKLMVENLKSHISGGRAGVSAHFGPENRREALEDATFAVNVIRIGGYRPATVIDFEFPKKYGLHQTIADSLGTGGIFHGLRTIPVIPGVAREMEAVCPDALLLNYTNPTAIVTGAVLRATGVPTVGLCHSVQSCVPHLLRGVGMVEKTEGITWRIAGINHMAWLLDVEKDGKDLYPEMKRRAFAKNDAAVAGTAEKHDDMVRFEVMRHFGYYVTASFEHNAECTPYWIKSTHPDLIDRYNIPLDEHPRRCEDQICKWATQRDELVKNRALDHSRSHESGSYIMDAVCHRRSDADSRKRDQQRRHRQPAGGGGRGGSLPR